MRESIIYYISSLDVRTLCTARLVCRPFRQAASSHLTSLTLSAGYLRSHPDISFGNLPNVNRVTISHVDCEAGDLQMLGHHNICNAVTDMKLVNYRETTTTSILPDFPNLKAMTVHEETNWNTVRQLRRFPSTLQELLLEDSLAVPRADALNCLTRLTSLSLQMVRDQQLPCRALSIFSALRRLDISCTWEDMPSFSELTQLTHFVWRPSFQLPFDSAPLTQLQGLVHFVIEPPLGEFLVTPELFGHIGRITTLRSLDIRRCQAPAGFLAAEAATALGPLCLTSLGLRCCCIDLASLSRVTLEGLQDLTLSAADHLSQDGLLALGWATGLTELDISSKAYAGFGDVGFVAQDLCQTISGMSRLQALSITTSGLPGISCSSFVGSLTLLTSLFWRGDRITDADVSACLGLRKLRVLSLWGNEPAPAGSIRREAVLELAKFPDLLHFILPVMHGCMLSGDLGSEVHALLTSKRDSRGWPPLY